MRSALTPCLFAALLLAAVPASSQDQITPTADSTDAPVSVSIPDSPAAIEKLDKAKEKEDQQQWKTAAEYYQDAIAKYAHRVVPEKIDKDAEIFQYVGVPDRVQKRLAKWPPEGLNAYRAAYGQTAEDLLAAGRDDPAALDNIFQTYFITDAGKSAGLRLMDFHLEAGHFFAAAWVGQRLLDVHPGLNADRAMVLFQTALAYHWAGDSAKAHALLDELKQKHSTDVGSIGGKDVVLADALEIACKSPIPTPTTQPTDADHWPTFGGPDGRGEISSSSARPGASLHSIQLVQPAFDRVPPPQRLQYEQTDQQDMLAGQMTGIMPAADRGALFFQDGRRIYAVNADSGQPLPGWSANNLGSSVNDVFGRPRGEELTICVTPTRALAILGQMDRQAPLVGQDMSPSVRIVCLDRSNGKRLWSRAPADLPESIAPLRTTEYNGTPLVVGNDSVLVVARGGQGNEFEDCYVVCLSLQTGDYKWSTYIGSSSRALDGEIGQSPQSTSEMSLAEGRVFVLSNLGTVAALNPADGRMIWLDSYPRQAIDDPANAALLLRRQMMGNGTVIQSKPWANNPVIVSDGKVFVLPAEGKDLLVYDAGSGEEIKRIATSDYENADVLLGVRDHAAVLTSNKYCYCIDWSAYDPQTPNNAILWDKLAVADPMAGQENTIFGRGFLTNDSVFIPTRHRLVQLSWAKSGKLVSTYPARGSWPGAEEPGNVLVTAKNVIVAGSRQVSIYTDLQLLRREYQDRIAAAPEDPAPRIWFAEILFAADAVESLATLDQAINLIGGPVHMRSVPDRQRIFNTAMHFAQQSASENTADSAGVTEKCFERAAAAAESPFENASYRLARANDEQQKKNYSQAVSLCQEILSDPAMRDVPISENSTAGALAESAINQAIQADRSSYSAIEKTAAAALAAAKNTTNSDKLLAIGLTYPNSSAAIEARQAVALLFENHGDHHQAIQTLQKMYAAATDPAVKTRLLESISRNFLALPNGLAPAIDRLSRAIHFSPSSHLSQALVLPDGGSLANLSLVDAVAALRKLQSAKDAATLPDFQLMVPKSFKDKVLATTDASIIANVQDLVSPLREFMRNDRVVTWSGSELSIFSVGTTTPLCSVKLPQEPIAAAWVDHHLFIWTSDQLMRLNEQGTEWTTDLHGLPSIELASDADALTDEPSPPSDGNTNLVVNGQIIGIAPGGININGPGRIVIRNGVAMRLAVNPPPIFPAAGAAAVTGEQIAAVAPAGDRILVGTSTGRLLALDARQGQIVWQIQLSDTSINHLLANSHFTVVRLENAAESQLVVLDTARGQVIGRRKFGPENSPDQLVNAALSENASLAYTLSGRLLVKDLDEPWKLPPTELTGTPDADPPTFQGLDKPDQLLIQAGHVLALYDGGKFVRTQDLAASHGPGNPLASGSDSNNVWLRLVGAQLFIVHAKTMARYNLNDVSDHGMALVEDFDFPPHIRQMLLGRDYAILVDDPNERGPAGSQFVRLLAYRRYPADPHTAHESGQLDDDPLINNTAGILSWQGVDGGLYYLSGDQKLHFLKGARSDNPNSNPGN